MFFNFKLPSPSVTGKIMAATTMALLQCATCYGLDSGVTATATASDEKRAMNIATQKAKAIAKKKYPTAKNFAVAAGCYEKEGRFVASVTLSPEKDNASTVSKFAD